MRWRCCRLEGSFVFVAFTVTHQMSSTPVHKFQVEMTCEGCSGAVKRVLGKLEQQIEDVNIDLESKIVLVKSNMTSEQLLEVIRKTGKTTNYLGLNQ
ncbi:copper transport protein ATOX1 [Phlebotomus argentipes]|uniref:copper transport protein ATOX1 n=1 Tax=Phlebotomus argentipes TaxID=94469 RepID=UPI00289351CB|nr:copper transport protein ATOX1 [Phlebotomus argentipes]